MSLQEATPFISEIKTKFVAAPFGIMICPLNCVVEFVVKNAKPFIIGSCKFALILFVFNKLEFDITLFTK